jgi:hypothetical protein
VHEFLGLIPSQTSDYRSTKNEKKYFVDTDLDKKKPLNLLNTVRPRFWQNSVLATDLQSTGSFYG